MGFRKNRRMTEEARDFATVCFARYMGPTQVADAVNARYGDGLLDKRTAQHYDPTVKMGQQLGKKRKALFKEARERFLAEVESIPIANKAMRLQQLQVHYEKITSAVTPNIRLALEILEKAAKEAGGVHSNEHHVHHTGKLKVEDVSEDEMRNGLAAAIAQALGDEKARLDPATVTKH